LVLLCTGASALLVGCHDSSGSSGGTVTTAFTHENVALLDELGQPLQAGSTEPYSPRETCGACHWIDQIANGYHFSQGRTNAAGGVVTEPDYFDDGRSYIRSAGMYGKW
jgi:hypothetical protein